MLKYQRKDDSMRNLMQKFMIFMQGRYGTDTLNNCILVFSLVFWFINIFVFSLYASLILTLLELSLIGLAIFRSLSRNINKRSAENRKFLPVYNSVKGWVKLNHQKFKERKDFKYLKCPICKAQLRVRNVKGVHTVCCPKCKSEFKKKI